MIQQFKTWAPIFPGFYSTVFEYSGEEDDIRAYNEENKTTLKWDDFNFDYRDYEQRVSKKFVTRLERELSDYLEIKLSFENLYSPREYNFSNDSINITAEFDLDILISLISKEPEPASQYFKNKYTSYSGFIPFHSNRLEQWLDKSYILADAQHRTGALLECLCYLKLDVSSDEIFYWVDGEYWIDFGVKEQV